MTAVPPPVPPEIVEKAAKAWHDAMCDRFCDQGAGESHRCAAETVIAAVYGDIVEAARRDALTEAVEAIGAALVPQGNITPGPYWIGWGNGCAEAVSIVTYLRDATAPRTVPAATQADQGADPRTPGTNEAQIGRTER